MPVDIRTCIVFRRGGSCQKMKLQRIATLVFTVLAASCPAVSSLAGADSATSDPVRISPAGPPPAAQCSGEPTREGPSGESALVAVREALEARKKQVADAPTASPGVLLNARGYNYGAAPGVGLEMRQAEIDATGR